MMTLTEREIDKAIALCDAIVQSAGRMEKMIAEAKREIAVLARDLAKAMEDADKC
jgi:hypothetical protein